MDAIERIQRPATIIPQQADTDTQLIDMWLVRRAGLITTDDHDRRQPRTWRAVGAARP